VSASSDVILSTHIEPADDIKEERKKTSFNVNELARYLNGGEEALRTR
jgi:acyl-CoA oxidase